MKDALCPMPHWHPPRRPGWMEVEEAPFFHYTTKRGLKLALAAMTQKSRLHSKQDRLGLQDKESASSIKLIWDSNKPSEIQIFLWQLNSRGLPTGSWCAHMGLPSTCGCCYQRHHRVPGVLPALLLERPVSLEPLCPSLEGPRPHVKLIMEGDSHRLPTWSPNKWLLLTPPPPEAWV